MSAQSPVGLAQRARPSGGPGRPHRKQGPGRSPRQWEEEAGRRPGSTPHPATKLWSTLAASDRQIPSQHSRAGPTCWAYLAKSRKVGGFRVGLTAQRCLLTPRLLVLDVPALSPECVPPQPELQAPCSCAAPRSEGRNERDKALPSPVQPRRHPMLPRDQDWVACPLLDWALPVGSGGGVLGGDEGGVARGQARGVHA